MMKTSKMSQLITVLCCGLLLLPLSGAAQMQQDAWERNYAQELSDDNALKYYAQALLLVDYDPIMQVGMEIDSILENGWIGKHPKVGVLFKKYQDAFKKVREGMAQPNLEVPLPPGGLTPESPIPNFFRSQLFGKLMIARGKYKEAKKDLSGAADMYIMALRLGSGFYLENTLLLSKLIGIAMQDKAYDALTSLMNRNNLDNDTLTYILSHLLYVDSVRCRRA